MTSRAHHPGLFGVPASVAVVAVILSACWPDGPSPTPRDRTTPSFTAIEPSRSAPGRLGTTWEPGHSLCELLGPDDFAGIPGVTDPADRPYWPKAYCIFTPGRSGAQGGVEFDAIVDAHPGSGFSILTGDLAGKLVNAAVPEADRSVIAVQKSFPSAFIAVQEGYLAFAIWVPNGPRAEATLRRLVDLVLERARAAIEG